MHWNQPRWEAIKHAYNQKYGKRLAARVKGETSGKYENMLVAIIG
jgi:annexin A7/11